jgi:MerR family transcriptional regulator, light-induced transcriptional regulator
METPVIQQRYQRHAVETEGHPIRVVSRRTGLSPHVIRVWEKRYQAVVPSRTNKNRRLYSDEDIRRLNLLSSLIKEGRRIGDIANLPTDDLEAMLAEDRAAVARISGAPLARRQPGDAPVSTHLERSIHLAISMEDDELMAELVEAHVQLGDIRLIDELIMPLLERIGELWEQGRLRVAEEHLVGATLRTFLGNLAMNHSPAVDAPHLTVTTPEGHVHEYGALIAAAVAVSEGWRTSYMGPSLPAEEIVAAVRTKNSRAVAISIVFPEANSRVVDELQKLVRLIPEGCKLIAGGSGIARYRENLEQAGLLILDDMRSFRRILRSIMHDKSA